MEVFVRYSEEDVRCKWWDRPWWQQLAARWFHHTRWLTAWSEYDFLVSVEMSDGGHMESWETFLEDANFYDEDGELLYTYRDLTFEETMMEIWRFDLRITGSIGWEIEELAQDQLANRR